MSEKKHSSKNKSDKFESFKIKREKWLSSKENREGWVIFRRDGLGALICKHNGNKDFLLCWFENREEAESYWLKLFDDTRAITEVVPCKLGEVLVNLPILCSMFPGLNFSAFFKEDVPKEFQEETTVFDRNDGTIHERKIVTYALN